MRVFALLVILSCSKGPPPPAELASLISADAVGILRQPPEQFAVLLYSRDIAKDEHGELPACWKDLEHGIVAGYQVSLPVGSYFILEGDLREAAVTECVASATHDLIKARSEGDLVAFTTPSATIYAAWRGKYLVIGNKQRVEQAVGAQGPELLARWRTLLVEPAKAPVWMVRTDGAFADLVGAPATSFLMVFDTMAGPPKSYVAGRFAVHYASAQDAEKGERYVKDWIARGRFPRKIEGPTGVVALYDQLAAALQRAPIKRDGAVLQLTFDSGMFGGMWEQLANAAAELGAKTN